MNIDTLTIKELKELVSVAQALNLCGSGGKPPAAPVGGHTGQYVIVRSDRAGVFAGIVQEYDPVGGIITLNDCRRLWSWQANAGVALSGVAVHGLKSGKVDAMTQGHTIGTVIEVLPCTASAEATIRAQ